MPTHQLSVIKNTAEQILSHPTWDLVLVFALLAIAFFYGISTGKGRIAATLIYTYAAMAIFSAAPLEKVIGNIGFPESFFIKAGIFLAVFLIIIFLLGSRRRRNRAPAGVWWQIFLLSFLQIGLLIHFILGLLPPEKIKILAPLTKNVFANPGLNFWWVAAPILVLILLRWLERRSEY